MNKIRIIPPNKGTLARPLRTKKVREIYIAVWSVLRFCSVHSKRNNSNKGAAA